MPNAAQWTAWLEKVPASFWGVVFGSFLSIVGVWLTNRAGERRLQAQFAHELGQKVRDREIAFKKEIYLDALVGLVANIRVIGSLANIDKSDDQVLAPHPKSERVPQVLVVAGEKTAKATAILSDQTKATFLKLYPKRLELMIRNQHLRGLAQTAEKHINERQRLLEIMRQKNLAGDVNPQGWATLNAMFEFETKGLDGILQQQKEGYESLVRDRIAFTGDCVEATRRLGKAVAPVLAGIRAELDLSIEEKTLATLVEDSSEVRDAYTAAMSKFAEMAGAHQAAGGETTEVVPVPPLPHNPD